MKSGWMGNSRSRAPWQSKAAVLDRSRRADGQSWRSGPREPTVTPAAATPAFSDNRGIIRVWGLAPGRYRMLRHAAQQGKHVEAPSETSRFVRTCHLASMSESNAVDVLLGTEDAAGIDIRMQRSVTNSVSGSVVEAPGSPPERRHSWAAVARRPGGVGTY